MSDAAHTPPDRSRTSLVRNAGGAVGLIVVLALAFWGVGALGSDPGDDGTAAPSPATEDEPAADADGAEDGAAPDEPPGDDAPDDAEATDGTDGEGDTDDAPEDEPTDDEPADDEPADDEPADDEPADDEPAENEPADDEPADDGEVERTVAPAEVTVQVLDGVKDDGGAAADGVADVLAGAGYDIIARNDALSYDVTTVLYNAGNEAAAEQVAAELGGAEVREQPGNLSTAVDLHVVVGRDRA